MIGWWTVLDVIKRVKASARRARDGSYDDRLAAFLIAAANVVRIRNALKDLLMEGTR